MNDAGRWDVGLICKKDLHRADNVNWKSIQRCGDEHVHHEYTTVKKCVFSLAQNVDSELALRMSFGSEFQTFGAATQNARLAVSVRVHGTERRGASVDRRDRVATWRCRSSSMYGGMEVHRALCVMTAILYWMRC